MFLFDTSRVIVKLIIGIFLCFNISAFANQCNTNSSIADVVEKLSPAIVNISTTQLVENGNKNLPFSEMPEEFFKFFEESFPSLIFLQKSLKFRIDFITYIILKKFFSGDLIFHCQS